MIVEFGNSNIKVKKNETIKSFDNYERFLEYSISYETKIWAVFTSSKYKNKSIKDLKNICILNKENISLNLHYEYDFTGLGIDRILIAEYIYEIIKKDFVFYSFGTATTVNLIKDGVFKGGYIVPSKNMMLKGFETIKEVKKNLSSQTKTANNPVNTSQALYSGIYLMQSEFLKKIIKKHINIKNIFITGGEALIPFYLFENFYYDKELIIKAIEYIIQNKKL
ncbi:MAG: type III pantothenate kinase [Candidatus Muiribacteriota bacterium]